MILDPNVQNLIRNAIQPLENRIRRLEKQVAELIKIAGKKHSDHPLNPYDLGDVAKLRNKAKP